jgi:hypothetical protein
MRRLRNRAHQRPDVKTPPTLPSVCASHAGRGSVSARDKQGEHSEEDQGREGMAKSADAEHGEPRFRSGCCFVLRESSVRHRLSRIASCGSGFGSQKRLLAARIRGARKIVAGSGALPPRRARLATTPLIRAPNSVSTHSGQQNASGSSARSVRNAFQPAACPDAVPPHSAHVRLYAQVERVLQCHAAGFAGG